MRARNRSFSPAASLEACVFSVVAMILIGTSVLGRENCEAAEECEMQVGQTDPAPYVIGAFGREQFPAPYGPLWEKWRAARIDIETDVSLIVRCRGRTDCPWPAVAKYAAIVDEAAKRRGYDRLDYVNRAINGAIGYVEDFAAFGSSDQWLSPITSIQHGTGDCEDYAIAKFVALRLAGLHGEERQLVLVRDLVKRREHMVLGARQQGRWYILDNLSPRLREDTELPHYVSLFAIDDRGVRQFGKPAPTGGFRLMDLVSTCRSAFG